MLRYWILDESGEPLETDLDTWSGLFANRQRIILQETVDGYFISTVFVGCNVRFETMVFRPDDDAVWQARSNTKAEALADHERALRAGDNLALFPGPAYRSRPR